MSSSGAYLVVVAGNQRTVAVSAYKIGLLLFNFSSKQVAQLGAQVWLTNHDDPHGAIPFSSGDYESSRTKTHRKTPKICQFLSMRVTLGDLPLSALIGNPTGKREREAGAVKTRERIRPTEIIPRAERKSFQSHDPSHPPPAWSKTLAARSPAIPHAKESPFLEPWPRTSFAGRPVAGRQVWIPHRL